MSEHKKSAVQPGWKVVGSKGKYIGKVEHVREDHLVVAQGRFIQHTLYIPVDHVATSADGQVSLTVTADESDAQGWRFPPNAGFTHGEADFWDSPVAAAGKARSTTGLGTQDIHGSFHDGKIDSEQVSDQSAKDDEPAFEIPPDEKG